MRIGVFDSGVGGITVLRELRRAIPGADYTYLGDTAHVPYGGKSPAQVARLSRDCAERLISAGVDAIVVACNTASSLALTAIREVAKSVPVFGVVEPGVEAALSAAGSGSSRPILVLATRATVASGAYGRALRARRPAGSSVIEQACPLLAPMIEEGWIDHAILHQTVAEYVGPHRAVSGVALLACTHYPWIQAAVARALPGWVIVNSAEAVAQAVRTQLGSVPPFGAQAGSAGSVAGGARGAIDWRFTDPDAVPAFARTELPRV